MFFSTKTLTEILLPPPPTRKSRERAVSKVLVLSKHQVLGEVLTQVSYILSGFSFLRVDLEERQRGPYSVGEKNISLQKVPRAEATSGSGLGHRQLVSQNKAS